MKRLVGMKRLALIFAGAGLGVWFLLVGFEYYRESQALTSSGIGLSRMSVDLVYKSDASVHFGADSTTEFVFSLPTGVSGINWCGKQGYSEVELVDLAEILKLPGAPKERVMGCVRRVTTNYGKATTFILLERRIVIKIMV